jgi:hypothetical protein
MRTKPAGVTRVAGRARPQSGARSQPNTEAVDAMSFYVLDDFNWRAVAVATAIYYVLQSIR